MLTIFDTEWPGDDPLSAFVDPDIEFEDSGALGYTHALATVMQHGLATEDAKRIAYTGFGFATKLGAMFLGGSPRVSYGALRVDPDISADDLRENFAAWAEEYLGNRPVLDEMTGRFARRASPDGRYNRLARVAVGTTLLCIEAGTRDDAVDREVAAFAAALEASGL